MTARVSFTPNGLMISKPGVDLSVAGRKDLLFSANDRSMPILSRLSGTLPASFANGLTLNYPKTFSNVPLSIVYYASSAPGANGPIFVLSGLGSSSDSSWPWAYNVGSGHTVSIAVRRYTDRIEVQNVLNAASGSDVSPVGGWISAVLFDYG